MSKSLVRSLLLALVLLPTTGAKRDRGEPIEDLPQWASRPGQVKLEIVEQLVLDKKQYAAAAPIIAQLRREGHTEPILDLIQGVTFREQGLLDESERLLISARKRSSGDPRVHRALCILYSDAMRLVEAIGSCEKAVRMDDADARGWNNLGYLYLSTDRYTEAVEAMQNAVDRDGANARYMNNLAMATVAAGNPEMALNMLLAHAALPNATYNVGVAVERYQTPDAALQWYSRTLKADPSHGLALSAVDRIENSSTESPPEPQK